MDKDKFKIDTSKQFHRLLKLFNDTYDRVTEDGLYYSDHCMFTESLDEKSKAYVHINRIGVFLKVSCIDRIDLDEILREGKKLSKYVLKIKNDWLNAVAKTSGYLVLKCKSSDWDALTDFIVFCDDFVKTFSKVRDEFPGKIIFINDEEPKVTTQTYTRHSPRGRGQFTSWD